MMLCCYYGVLFSQEMEHGVYDTDKQCGPFENESKWQDTIIDEFTENSTMGVIWENILTNETLLWGIIIAVIVRYYFKKNYKQVASKYIRDKEVETG
jgi:hypothetical protein